MLCSHRIIQIVTKKLEAALYVSAIFREHGIFSSESLYDMMSSCVKFASHYSVHMKALKRCMCNTSSWVGWLLGIREGNWISDTQSIDWMCIPQQCIGNLSKKMWSLVPRIDLHINVCRAHALVFTLRHRYCWSQQPKTLPFKLFL